MQNRYVGDVGDFGKLGMLRCIERTGLRVGINWYLVKDETHNDDGKHIGYLQDRKFVGLDEELRRSLAFLIYNNSRSVEQLEGQNLLQTGIYYHEILSPVSNAICQMRSAWHQKALEHMKGSELVFLDPDNGLLPKSVGRGSAKSVKYVLADEIIDYFEAGHSVVFYSHRTREQLKDYLCRFNILFDNLKSEGATIVGVSFKRGTVRDCFFILHEEHKDRVLKGIENLLMSNWNLHFSIIEI